MDNLGGEALDSFEFLFVIFIIEKKKKIQRPSNTRTTFHVIHLKA